MKILTSLLAIITLHLALAYNARAAMPEIWAESYRLETAGQYVAAIKTLAPVLAKYPRHEFAHLRLGWLNYLQGNHNDAIEEYKIAMTINSKSLDARLGATLPLLAQQRWREAAFYARQVIEMEPWNYYAHIRLMICEEAEGQWEALQRHASDVTLRYPSDATVQVYLARAFARLGMQRQAQVVYEQILERIPRHIEATRFLDKVVH